jgi:hypothetical protein
MKLGENTFIPIGFLFAAASLVGGGGWWMSALYSRVAKAEDSVVELKSSQGETVRQLQQINETLIEIRAEMRSAKRGTAKSI